MIKKFVTWLYLRVVYLPLFREKIEKQYPGAKVTYSTATEDYYDDELKRRIMRQAELERKWISDDHLH